MRMSLNMVMKLGLSQLAILLFLCSGVSVLGTVVMQGYFHLTDHKNWWDARAHCRSWYHNDLGTIYTRSDSDSLIMKDYYAWVGLYRHYSNWYWSNSHTSYNPQWASGEQWNQYQYCACIRQHNKMLYSSNCNTYQFFYCLTHDNNGTIFVPESKTWEESKDYCRDEYDHLGYFSSSADQQSIGEEDFPIWTGLHRDGDEWKWSSETSSEYRKWAPNQPSDDGDCVTISSLTKEMTTRDCNDRFPYLCYRDSVVLVKENKTWEQALEHCRNLVVSGQSNYELLSVEPVDHSYLINRMVAGDVEKVWVGLRFLASEWLWVNSADLQYTNLPDCPVDGKHCAAFTRNNTGDVETTDCMEELNFLCYRQ